MGKPLFTDDTVRVEGLRDFRAALKQLDDPKKWEDKLKDANYRVGDLVVQRAKDRAIALGRMQAAAADGIASRRQAALALVVLDARDRGSGVPWLFGAEFGANQEATRSRSTGTYVGFRQFEPWKGASKGAGFFFWPTIRDEAQAIRDAYETELDSIVKEAFPS